MIFGWLMFAPLASMLSVCFVRGLWILLTQPPCPSVLPKPKLFPTALLVPDTELTVLRQGTPSD
jgi:hypothetical protein